MKVVKVFPPPVFVGWGISGLFAKRCSDGTRLICSGRKKERTEKKSSHFF